ncbi:MAG: type II toxin-antitoxin system VapC family toxin [Methylocystis sp.]|nr:type II toxin-antitoxin system VapC family toxin [Methylocystis sp.]MBI3274802.1 type II toxin-antitoxin system VapC family toxin [Methylocystis sp.]
MTYLLDTNVLSELRRRDRTDANVAAWADSVRTSCLYLSVITILEIEAGALMIERRDSAQGAILREWIDKRVLPAFEGRVLAVDVPVARCCARLHAPNPRAERDALIAATAIVHRMTVVTRNVRDFAPMGVKTFDPWTAR